MGYSIFFNYENMKVARKMLIILNIYLFVVLELFFLLFFRNVNLEGKLSEMLL